MDSRFLPAAVIPPPPFFFDAGPLEARAFLFLPGFDAPSPVNAAIAREILSASLLRSAIRDPTSIMSPFGLRASFNRLPVVCELYCQSQASLAIEPRTEPYRRPGHGRAANYRQGVPRPKPIGRRDP